MRHLRGCRDRKPGGYRDWLRFRSSFVCWAFCVRWPAGFDQIARPEKTDIDEAVSADVRREMEAYGVRVSVIALKDIILPGDIRDILNQVVTAEKQAQANLIRRREETAATRSLLNTAKLMEGNPLLVRLKELETLEKVADKVEKITVVGGLNALLERTVTLRAE
jgi:regulator of protease activity HflC (stomatin/prohibitin superfamily)